MSDVEQHNDKPVRLGVEAGEKPVEFQGTAGRYWLVGPGQLAAMRKIFREAGPNHRLVDRWRYVLGWNVEPEVVHNFLLRDLPRKR